MGFHRQDKGRAGKASAAIGALLLLGGCATHHAMFGTPSDPTINRDDWLTTANADLVVNAMAAKGMIPATIDCRFDSTVPGQVAYGSKFTWKRAPANSRYHWEVGDPTYLASKEVRANRVGLRRLFAKEVRDPATGQKVGCSIWVG